MSGFSQEHHDPDLHLFIDDEEVREAWNFTRQIGRMYAHPEPLSIPDRPWEKDRLFCPYCGGIVVDPASGKLRMYYFSFGDHTKAAVSEYPKILMMCMAQSDDGMNWEVPNLGLVEWDGSRDNNIVYYGGTLSKGDPEAIHDVRGPVLIDPTDGEFPYKLLGWGQNLEMWNTSLPAQRRERLLSLQGYYLMKSSDGLRWTDPVKVKHGGDTFGCSWDARRGVWMMADRMYQEPKPDGSFVRLIEMFESPDLSAWTSQGAAMVLSPSLAPGLDHGKRRQLWGMMPFLYGNRHIGLIGFNTQTELDFRVSLAASRDGREWCLPMGDERFLPVGEPDSWNGQTNCFTLNAPVRIDDRLYIYYTARYIESDGTPEHYLGVAGIGLDRFIGMSANGPGFIITEPVPVTRPFLDLSMCHYDGYMQVEVRDANNRAVPGYEMENCARIQGRGPRCRVTWQDKKDLAGLVGKACIFKFSAVLSTFYGYRFSSV